MNLKVLLTTLFLASVFIVNAQKPDNPLIFQKEINAFAKADSIKMPEPGVIVFTGSSSIRGWRSVGDDFPELNVINRGFGGSRIGDATYYFDQLITKYKPTTVVFYSGENDIASGKTPEMALERFKEFVATMEKKVPDANLIYLSMKPSILRWNMWDDMVEANKLIEDYIAGKDWIEYVDVASPMLGEDGKPLPEIFLGDDIHMNAKGYEIWTKVVKPYLED